MLFHIDFFLDGKYYGRGVYDYSLQKYYEPRGTPHSYLWVCPYCGELWGRALVSYQEGTSGRSICWVTYNFPCRKCPTNGWREPGSITMKYLDALNTSLPVEALNREVLMLINHFERKSENDTLEYSLGSKQESNQRPS